MVFGYARVSTQEQNLDRQLDSLNSAGAEEIIQEKITGTKADRPELNRLLDKLRKGDVMLVSDLTRLSRSTKDLFGLVDQIERKGANIKSLKESWLDTTTPQGKLMFTFMAGISQFERDLISQRTKEGLEAARARGRKGGRKPKLDDNKKRALDGLRSITIEAAIGLLWTTGLRPSELCRLKIKDIDFETGLVYIKKTKFNKERIIPIHSSVINKLKQYSLDRELLNKGNPSEFFFNQLVDQN